MPQPSKMTFDVRARRIDEHHSTAEYKDATIRRLDLLHENVKKYGTVFNTVAPGTRLEGRLRRRG